MKNKLVFLPVIFFSLIFATCKKQPDTSNSFYFQCKINGQIYIPGLGNGLTCELLADTTLLLGGNLGYQALGMGIINVTGQPILTTSYTLNYNPRYKADYKYSTTTNDIFNTDATHIGQINVTTLDKTNKIIQGTFYFKAYNAFRNDSVSVTEGTFRLHYIIS
jgi:hypothetical protein